MLSKSIQSDDIQRKATHSLASFFLSSLEYSSPPIAPRASLGKNPITANMTVRTSNVFSTFNILHVALLYTYFPRQVARIQGGIQLCSSISLYSVQIDRSAVGNR